MALSSSDRTVLFGTAKVSIQIQKYIEAKRQAGREEIQQVFSEVPAANLRAYLKRLIDRGAVRFEQGVYIATYSTPVFGFRSDAAWKAARILKTFKAEDIARVGDVDIAHAKRICDDWREKGYLVVMGRDGRIPIYRFVSDLVVRPVGSEGGSNG
jgi:hypothetical protein